MQKPIFPTSLNFKFEYIPWLFWAVIIVLLLVAIIITVYLFILILGIMAFVIIFAALGDEWFW